MFLKIRFSKRETPIDLRVWKNKPKVCTRPKQLKLLKKRRQAPMKVKKRKSRMMPLKLSRRLQRYEFEKK